MLEKAVDFVRYVLEQICQEKDSIVVESSTDERGAIISIKVAEADMGKVIGKAGQNIASLRALVRIIGSRENQRISIKVLDSDS